MSVRQHPTKGPGWWQIIVYPEGRKGKQRVIVFEGSLAEAEELAHAIRLEIRGEDRPLATLPKINQVVPDFMRWYGLDHLPAGVIVMRRYMRYMVQHFGNRQLASITHADFERYKQDRLAEGIARVTINKEISALNQLIAYGAERGYCRAIKGKRFAAKLTKSPLPDVPTREECERFISAMLWPAQGFFACLYYAGLRKAEAAGLTAESVYLDRGMMIVRGKGNKQRAVPIASDLRPYLERRLAEIDSGLLWTNRHGRPLYDVRPHVKWALRRSGLSRRLYPHLLRHGFGTHGTMAGIGIRAMQKMLGHSSSQTTEIYTTLADEWLTEEIKRFER